MTGEIAKEEETDRAKNGIEKQWLWLTENCSINSDFLSSFDNNTIL